MCCATKCVKRTKDGRQTDRCYYLVIYPHLELDHANTESGHLVDSVEVHEKKINRVQFNKDKTLFLTLSADFNDAVLANTKITY